VYKVMLACRFDVFSEELMKQLETDCEVQICDDGNRLVRAYSNFLPDVLLMDMDLENGNVFSLLRILHMSGRGTKVISLVDTVNEYVLSYLQNCGVHCVLAKPCNISLAKVHIRSQLSQISEETIEKFNPGNEIDRLLLELGFRMGPSRYRCVFESVLYRYYHPDCAMKEIYIEVGIICGGSHASIEKAIRNAVEDAHKNTHGYVWDVLFPYYREKGRPYPNNEDFIARIANCVMQKYRTLSGNVR